MPVSARGFTRVPHTVTAALQQGDISLLEFTILVLMHKSANWKTGEVQSWSADRFLREAGDPEGIQQRTVRRAMQRLRDAGWYHHDYVNKSQRPYTVWLHNYVVRNEKAVAAEGDHHHDQDEIILSPCEIKPLGEMDHGHDRESDEVGDQEPHGQMSLKDHIRSCSNAARAEEKAGSPCSPALDAPALGSQRHENPKSTPTAPQDLFQEARDILGWLPATAPGALKRLQTIFTLDEIVREMQRLKAGNDDCDTAKGIKALFAEIGAQLEIGIRSARRRAEEKRQAEKNAICVKCKMRGEAVIGGLCELCRRNLTCPRCGGHGFRYGGGTTWFCMRPECVARRQETVCHVTQPTPAQGASR